MGDRAKITANAPRRVFGASLALLYDFGNKVRSRGCFGSFWKFLEVEGKRWQK